MEITQIMKRNTLYNDISPSRAKVKLTVQEV